MTEQKKCPWYVWGFSFLAMFVLFTVTTVRFLAALFRRKFDLELWGGFIAEGLFDCGLLFMLPVGLLALVISSLSPAAWEWLGFPLAYLLGICPARRLWMWSKKHL